METSEYRRYGSRSIKVYPIIIQTVTVQSVLYLDKLEFHAIYLS